MGRLRLTRAFGDFGGLEEPLAAGDEVEAANACLAEGGDTVCETSRTAYRPPVNELDDAAAVVPFGCGSVVTRWCCKLVLDAVDFRTVGFVSFFSVGGRLWYTIAGASRGLGTENPADGLISVADAELHFSFTDLITS